MLRQVISLTGTLTNNKKLFQNIKQSLLIQPIFNFSSGNSQKIKQILQQFQIDIEGKKQSLLQSGMITQQHLDPDTSKLTIQLKISKDYMKIKSALKTSLQNAGISNVDISMAPKQQKPKQSEKGLRKGNLSQVKKIIAVSSCKGGVGKSTIAINLAANLRNLGHRVGVFDSDIYGPSLPTLINREGETLEPSPTNPKDILPKYYEQMPCMSFGFVGSKPAAMRGPMVSSIVSQLLHNTQWGELDYLVVDMPPGTGDIQISLCQELKFDGALIVTTPQRLAFMDVIKGIQMFQDLRVRILGVVENMAYYECSKCGHKDQVFGKGYSKMITQQFGIDNAFKIPLMGDITKYSDLGTPLAFVLPQSHTLRQTYNHICKQISVELQKPTTQANAYYSKNQNMIIVSQLNKTKKIAPYHLRLACKCAGCIDQLSGAMILKKENIPEDVYPLRVEEKGNYAVAVVWSDGHKSSIYPYKRLLGDEIIGQ